MVRGIASPSDFNGALRASLDAFHTPHAVILAEGNSDEPTVEADFQTDKRISHSLRDSHLEYVCGTGFQTVPFVLTAGRVNLYLEHTLSFALVRSGASLMALA